MSFWILYFMFGQIDAPCNPDDFYFEMCLATRAGSCATLGHASETKLRTLALIILIIIAHLGNCSNITIKQSFYGISQKVGYISP